MNHNIFLFIYLISKFGKIEKKSYLSNFIIQKKICLWKLLTEPFSTKKKKKDPPVEPIELNCPRNLFKKGTVFGRPLGFIWPVMRCTILRPLYGRPYHGGRVCT